MSWQEYWEEIIEILKNLPRNKTKSYTTNS